MAEAGRLEYIVTVDSSGVNSGLSKAESQVKGSGNKMSAWTVAKGQMIGRMIERAGAATVRATSAFVKSSISEGMNFDKSMSQVAATLGKSVDEVQDLSKFARQMGATTAFTAQQAAEGLNYMALAGYDAEKSMKMLPQVLNLAAAGNFDLARASDMVTDAQSALGLSIEETETLIDQMAKTASKSNTSVEQLGDAILTIGGTARYIKGGTRELTMLLGVLADNGMKGSVGGTALRNIISRLSAPTDKAAKELKALGVNAFDAQGNLRALPDVFSDFNEALSDKTMQERMEIFSEIFNVRDMKAAEALLGTSAERWKELGIEIENSSGAAKEMADTQLDNLAGDVTKLKSAIGETKLAISDKLSPTMRLWAQSATVFVGRITDAFKKNGLTGAIKETWSIFKEFNKNLGKRAKVKLSSWLDVGDDASWAEIARKAVTKIGEGFKNKLGKGGNFLLQMILGKDYKAGESTWKDAGTKISGWMTDAFSEGGILQQLLIGGADKLATIIKLAGEFITGVATWISENPDTISDIITSISTALTTAVPAIANALVEVLNNQDFQSAVMGLFGTFAEMLGKVFTEGPDALKGLMIGYGAKKGFDMIKWVKNLGLFGAGGGAAGAATSGTSFVTGLKAFLMGGGAETLGVVAAAVLPALLAQADTDRKVIADRERRIGAAQNDPEFKDVIEAGADALVNLDKNGGYKRNILGQLNLNPSDEPAAFLKGLASLTDQQKAEMLGRISSYAPYTNGEPTLDLLQKYWKNPNNEMFTYGLLRAMTENITDALAGIQVNERPKIPIELEVAEGSTESLIEQVGTPEIEALVKASKNAGALIAAQIGTIEIPATVKVTKISGGGGTAGLGGGGNNGGGGGGAVAFNPFGDFSPGNFAKGNWNVPYDNYPALLHRGELVMNKPQARQYRDGEGGFDMGGMISNAVSAAMSKVYVMLNGDKVGDLTSKRINKNINATSYNKLRAMGGY